MKNKIIKILSLILLITMVFNINMKDVSALECKWYTYETHIDKDNKYYFSSDVATQSGIYAVTYKSDRKGANFRIGYALKTDNTDLDINDSYGVLHSKFSDMEFDTAFSSISNPCENFSYVKVNLNDNNEIKSATKEEYQNFLKNQYSKIVDEDSGLKKSMRKGRYSHYNFCEISEDYTDGLKWIVFTNEKIPYKTEVLDKLKSKLGDEGIEKFSTFGIDVGESSIRYDLYNQVKDRWIPIARKQLIEAGYNFESASERKELKIRFSGDTADRQAFRLWFNLVQRYILEDYGLDDYVAYYTYAYDGFNEDGNDKVSQLRDLVYGDSEATESTDNPDDGGILYADCMDEKLLKLKKNKCLQYCIGTDKCSDNSNEVIACQNGSEYSTCYNAYKDCKLNSCKNIGASSAKDDCIEQCVKEKMGEEKYNSFISSYNNKYNEISGNASSAWEDAKETLSRIKAPSFSGIKFNGYKANCDDVSFLHKFYMILRIMAPILVILFGTIDYAKSVIGEDEKKILEARKKFPKRLILLILFILVPFIIEILIDLFSVSDTSLMRCVIKGA